MVIKRDPGQGLIWVAYLCLITGLVLTFYFPRRRVWARLDGGRLDLALAAERYVNAEREFEQLSELALRVDVAVGDHGQLEVVTVQPAP